MGKKLSNSPANDNMEYSQVSSSVNTTTENKITSSSVGDWPAALRILGNVTGDTTVFFGVASNLVTYLITVMHLGVAQSAKSVNNWVGTIFITPLIGAFIADTYLSRYATIALSYAFYLTGMVLITLAVSLRSLRPPACVIGFSDCVPASNAQMAFLFFALYVTALGSGSLKPCIISFGADQFDDKNPKGKVSFFNWMLWGIHCGGLLAVTLIVYAQDNAGWGWGFGIQTVIIAACVLLFFSGKSRYRYIASKGSPMTKLAQVFVAAARKRNLTGEETKLPFTLLSKAALKTEDEDIKLKAGQRTNPWKLCSISQVEDAKLITRMIPIWLGTLWFTTAPAQSATLFVRQASTMDNKLGSFKIPAASMLLFNNLAVILFIPVYDRFLVPLIRRFTKYSRGITLLQRIGIGMVIGILSMVVAARIEIKRVGIARVQDSSKSMMMIPMSIFWLVPQYLLLGLAEAMTNTGLLEFFYDQAPNSMQSLGTALSYASLGVGSFLSSILITLVNKITERRQKGGAWIQNDLSKSHLDSFYWLIAGISAFNLCLYLPLAHWYRYKNIEQIEKEMIEPKEQQNNLISPSVIELERV